jgi:putative Ca2+/H+ antiporter (TMEM165/GDT1 family)
MHSFDLAVTIFGVIFLAELPDKTALTTLVLATKYKPAPVFVGTALALAVQSGVAVVAGSLLSLLPKQPVHIGAGLVFLISAVVMWVRKEEEETEDGAPSATRRSFWETLGTAFGVVFLAEWGDLTQLATAAFAAREHAPWVVFGASTLALWAVAGIAVVVGRRTAHLLSPKTTKRVAAVLFAAIGVALLTGKL